MCIEPPLSIRHVSSLGVTNLESAENNTYSSPSSSFACFLQGTLELLGRLRLLVAFLLEVRLTSSLGMGA